MQRNTTLTEALGSHIVFVNASDAFVADLMISVLPHLNPHVAPLSYVAVAFPYSLKDIIVHSKSSDKDLHTF